MENSVLLSYPLFGSIIEITLHDVQQELVYIHQDDIIKESQRLQKIFNLYDQTSEISMLNQKREAIVSDELFFVLKKALSYCEATNGLYDISKGKLFLERKAGRLNCNNANNVKHNYKDILLKNNKVYLKKREVLIDLNSIAKGYVADRIAAYLKSLGFKSGIVNARGDIVCFGKQKEQIEIQHPRKKDCVIEKISCCNQSVATSGDYKQFHKTYKNSHILGSSDLISTTVIASNLTDADALATCCFLLGKYNASRLIQKMNCKAVLIYENQQKELINIEEKV